MMSVVESSVEIPGLRLAARVWGAEGGRRVLALHGWLDNAATFDRLAPLLDGMRLVAVDLPGHGRSDHRAAGCAYHFVDWVADVVAIADALGWSGFDLLGHSMGAGIASLVPAVTGERVERLVLIEGLGPLTRPAAEAPTALAQALIREHAPAAGRRVIPDLEAAIMARLARSDLSRDAAEILVRRGVEEVGEGLRFRHDPRLHLPSRLRFSEDQVTAFLAAIRCPVLVVHALSGLDFPAETMQARLAAVHRLELAEVEGGHHLHLVNPEVVAPVIRRFLQVPQS